MEKKSNSNRSIPQEVTENAANTINQVNQVRSWVDHAFQEHEQSGGFDNLEGKGKRLEIQDGDPLNSILKNANYLPKWLLLQHEIRDDLQSIINIMSNDSGSDMQAKIDEINSKIKKYNASVPNHLFQKSFISTENITIQVEKWT